MWCVQKHLNEQEKNVFLSVNPPVIMIAERHAELKFNHGSGTFSFLVNEFGISTRLFVWKKNRAPSPTCRYWSGRSYGGSRATVTSFSPGVADVLTHISYVIKSHLALMWKPHLKELHTVSLSLIPPPLAILYQVTPCHLNWHLNPV